MLSKACCCVLTYSFACNPINRARDYQVHTVGREYSTVWLFVCCSSLIGVNRDRWIVVVRTESFGSVEQSLLCNFLSAWIGQAVGLSVSQNQRMLCAGLTHPCLPFVKPTNHTGRPFLYPSIIIKQVCPCSWSQHIQYQSSHHFRYFPDYSNFLQSLQFIQLPTS